MLCINGFFSANISSTSMAEKIKRSLFSSLDVICLVCKLIFVWLPREETMAELYFETQGKIIKMFYALFNSFFPFLFFFFAIFQ